MGPDGTANISLSKVGNRTNKTGEIIFSLTFRLNNGMHSPPFSTYEDDPNMFQDLPSFIGKIEFGLDKTNQLISMVVRDRKDRKFP